MTMVLYWALVALLAWVVARAVEWYPAHMAQEEAAMLAAIAAQQAGDEARFAAWESAQGAAFGGVALRSFVASPPAINWQTGLAGMWLLLVAAWSFITHGATLPGASWLIFGAGLVVLAFVDAHTKLLPDALTLPLLWLGIVLQLVPETRTVGLEASIWGVLAGYLPLWLLAQLYRLLRGRDGLGMGDVKMLAAMGAWSGAALLPGVIFMASLLGIVGVLGYRLHQRLRRAAGGDQNLSAAHIEFPFGPWLIAAYMLCEALGFNMWKV